MKSLYPSLIIISLSMVAQAHAAGSGSITLACPVTQLPSHADVVRVFDAHNLGKVFALRQSVLHFARRACKRGADRIEIVAAPDHKSGPSAYLAER